MPNALQTIRAAANEAPRGARCALRRRRRAVARATARRGDQAHGRGAAAQARFRRRSVHGRIHAERMRQASMRRCVSIVARSSSTPRWSSRHVNLGKLLFGAGRFAEALACFAAATMLAPDDPDAWCSRAGALRELGRLEESVEAAERALELRHDFPEAAINLGNALLKLDRSEEALEAYLRASAPGPCLAKALLGQASGVAESWPLPGGSDGVRHAPRRSAAARRSRARAASC